MDDTDLKKILEIILTRIKTEKIVWRLDGSSNLKIQGMNVTINDLDITTNEEGQKIFKEKLKEYVQKHHYSKKINGNTLICKINNFEVEINVYGDREKEYFEDIKKIKWQGLIVPIMPLAQAKEFYERIGRDEKVELINKHLIKENKVKL
jgi:hypothetical protein